eukprot:TRINITY_DN12464_c0_g1_i1.p1 TRINITY_DN12464_c0_g1~~TRINITY_DN12464_c0_g1_i1.p1  ORF type:complete len:167 (+),score=39.99 TRINITY_DN12464_c0_g1_i1:51-551(+)
MAFDECCFCGGKDEEGVDFKEWSPCKGSTSVAPTRLTTAFSGLVPCSRGNEAVTANLAKEERLMFGHTDHADHAEKSSICITLKKVRGSKLGVDVDLSDGETMLVEKVMDGLVLDWNKAHPGQEIRRNDRIVCVNGLANDSQRMADACSKDGILEVTLVRISGAGA